MRKTRNAVQKQVGTKMKAKEPCDDMVAEIKQIGEAIVQKEEEQKLIKVELDRMIGKVGNIVEDGVPVSQDEDADNRVERKWGTPRDPAGLLSHHELLWRIGGYEPERGSAVAGHRGYFLRDVGVLLNQAFINYGIAFLRKRNYVPLQPPYMMNKVTNHLPCASPHTLSPPPLIYYFSLHYNQECDGGSGAIGAIRRGTVQGR